MTTPAGSPVPPGPTAAVDDPLAGVAGGLAAALEAVLLTADGPVAEEPLAQVLHVPAARVREELEALADGYRAAARGFELRRTGAGWRLYARADLHDVVRRFALDGASARLSGPALETLAVIAYRQPVTRARVAAVRGVDVHSVVRTLVAHGLVEEAGADPETGAVTYRTTGTFLERTGMASLDDLPPLAPLLPGDDELAGLEGLLDQRS